MWKILFQKSWWFYRAGTSAGQQPNKRLSKSLLGKNVFNLYSVKILGLDLVFSFSSEALSPRDVSSFFSLSNYINYNTMFLFATL